MSNITFDEAKKKIDSYFDSVTPEKLDRDLKKAGIDFYKEDEPREEVREKKKSNKHESEE
jgi:hypothetical protein